MSIGKIIPIGTLEKKIDKQIKVQAEKKQQLKKERIENVKNYTTEKLTSLSSKPSGKAKKNYSSGIAKATSYTQPTIFKK